MLAEDFKAVFPQIGDRAVAVGSERDARISMMRHDPLSPPVSTEIGLSKKPLEVSLLLQLLRLQSLGLLLSLCLTLSCQDASQSNFCLTAAPWSVVADITQATTSIAQRLGPRSEQEDIAEGEEEDEGGQQQQQSAATTRA